MDLKVPLRRFNEYVLDAEKIDLEHPYLKQHQWLLDNFAFDDSTASYEPRHQPWPRASQRNLWSPWWWRLSRN